MEFLREDQPIPELLELMGFAVCLQGALRVMGEAVINLMGEAGH